MSDMSKFQITRENKFTSGDGRTVNLYSVVVSAPNIGVQTHYVLALDPEMAGDMAKCAAGVAIYETPEMIQELVRTHVTKLQFTVQGWGKIKF